MGNRTPRRDRNTSKHVQKGPGGLTDRNSGRGSSPDMAAKKMARPRFDQTLLNPAVQGEMDPSAPNQMLAYMS